MPVARQFNYDFTGFTNTVKYLLTPKKSTSMDLDVGPADIINPSAFLDAWYHHLGDKLYCLLEDKIGDIVPSGVIPSEGRSTKKKHYLQYFWKPPTVYVNGEFKHYTDSEGRPLDTAEKFFRLVKFKLNGDGEFNPACEEVDSPKQSIFANTDGTSVEESLRVVTMAFSELVSIASTNRGLSILLSLTFKGHNSYKWTTAESRYLSLRELNAEIDQCEDPSELSFTYPTVRFTSERREKWEYGLQRNHNYSMDVTPYVDMFKGSGLHMGLELEVCINYAHRENILNTLGIGYCLPKSDSSVSSESHEFGLELVTGALGLDIHKRKLAALFKYLQKETTAMDQSTFNTNGLHINIGKKQVNAKDPLCGFKMKTFFSAPQNVYFLSTVSRRRQEEFSNYCNVVQRNIKENLGKSTTRSRTGRRKYKEANLFGKYSILNDSKRNVYEIRLFKGEMKWEFIIGALEFVEALYEFCCAHSTWCMTADHFLYWLDHEPAYRFKFLRYLTQGFSDRKPRKLVEMRARARTNKASTEDLYKLLDRYTNPTNTPAA